MHFKTNFEKPTIINDCPEIRKQLKKLNILVHPGATLRVKGPFCCGQNTEIFGDCSLGHNTIIKSGCKLNNVNLGSNNIVREYSLLENLIGNSGNIFGPFCFIRDNCKINNDCILGAHVETARSVFKSGVKVSHRAFIGDATIGMKTIIGAGVVFCNFNGVERCSSHVGKEVILGAGSLLIAPISISDRVIIGAGSTISKNVSAGCKVIQKRHQ